MCKSGSHGAGNPRRKRKKGNKKASLQGETKISHITNITGIEILNICCLKKAVEKLGWEFHEGKTLHKWYGRFVDDSPCPRNLFEKEEEYQRVLAMTRPERCAYMKQLLDHCDHVIHVPGFVYEIGVFKVGDTYQLSYDFVGDVTRVLGYPEEYTRQYGIQNPVNPLPQAYAVEVTKEALSREGWGWEEWRDEFNNHHIKAVQYS